MISGTLFFYVPAMAGSGPGDRKVGFFTDP